MTELLEQYSDLTLFRFRGSDYKVRKTGSMAVAEGVTCDTYAFDGDDDRDLGIIKMMPGSRTPRQHVIGGDHTIEGHVAGMGHLLVSHGGALTRPDSYMMQSHPSTEPFDMTIGRGEIMQWVASGHMALVASEVCYPPYAEGRFEDLA